MDEAAFRCFFSGRVRLFGKTGSHSRESLATNAASKNDLLWGQNKVERNCRHTQGAQQIKSPQYWVSSIGGTYHFCLLLSLYSEQHFRCFQVVWRSCFPVPA